MPNALHESPSISAGVGLHLAEAMGIGITDDEQLVPALQAHLGAAAQIAHHAGDGVNVDDGRTMDLPEGGRIQLVAKLLDGLEEQHVGRMRFELAQRRDAVAGLRDDVELGPQRAEQLRELFAQQRFVLGDDGAWSGHVAPAALRWLCSHAASAVASRSAWQPAKRQSALGVGQFWLATVWFAGRSCLLAVTTMRSICCCDTSSRPAPSIIAAFTVNRPAPVTAIATPRATSRIPRF